MWTIKQLGFFVKSRECNLPITYESLSIVFGTSLTININLIAKLTSSCDINPLVRCDFCAICKSKSAGFKPRC